MIKLVEHKLQTKKQCESFERLSFEREKRLPSTRYWDAVDNAFQEYETKRDNIRQGILDRDTYDWFIKTFDVPSMQTEDRDLLWRTIDAYFDDYLLDETGKHWRNDISIDDFEFMLDTDSAWKEALNDYSRKTRDEYHYFD